MPDLGFRTGCLDRHSVGNDVHDMRPEEIDDLEDIGASGITGRHLD